MEKIHLDTQKVKSQLNNLGKNYSWLAGRLGIDRQLLHYHIKNKTVKGAEMIAPIFGLSAKDLLK